MRKNFYPYLLFICLGCLVLLSGCGAKRATAGTIPSNDADRPVTGAVEYAYTYCYTEHGMLYPSGHLIRYYDFATDQTYILCDKANCSHGNEQCSAWYDDMTTPRGLAIYRDACYMFRDNYSDNTADFVSMDLTGNNQKTIAQFDLGNLEEEGGWQLNSIGDVYYVDDMVWFYTDYHYYTEEGVDAIARKYRGIRLSDGSQMTLEEPGHDSGSEMLLLEMVTNDYLVFSQQHHGMPMLTKKEFEAECEKGVFGDSFEDSEDPYYDYYRIWYPYHNEQTERYFVYTLDSGEMRLLEEHPTQFDIDTEGYGGSEPHYYFLGEYDGKLLCGERDIENDDSPLFLWDMETDTKTELTGVRGDEIMNYGQDTLANCVIDDTYTFYVRKTEKGEWIYDVFRLNIDTMESGPEIGEIDFDKSYLHLIADTPDWFIGRKLPDSIEGYMGGNPYTFYKISKEDYYNGDWEKAVKLHL